MTLFADIGGISSKYETEFASRYHYTDSVIIWKRDIGQPGGVDNPSELG